MQEKDSSYAEYQKGDKIRIRVGNYRGKKGIVQSAGKLQLEVHLEDVGMILVSPQDVTNFSLAARKAWQTMRSQSS